MSEEQENTDRPQSGLDALLRRLLTRAIRQCPMSPEQVCDELGKRVGRVVSPNMLQNWRANSKHLWRLPADCIAPLSEILGCDMIPRVVLPKHMRARLAVGEAIVRHPQLLEKGQVAKLLRGEGRKCQRVAQTPKQTRKA